MGKDRKPDPKVEALQQRGALNPSPEKVQDELFLDADFFDPRDLVQVKYEMLRRTHRDGWSVTHASDTYGLSRPTFYKAQASYRREGLSGLVPQKRGPRGPHKLSPEILDFIEALRGKNKEMGSPDLAKKIATRFGVAVHPRSIERALVRAQKKGRPRAPRSQD